MPLLGISGIANVMSAAKLARYYELDGRDIVVTVATDSLELYRSRLDELAAAEGSLAATDAAAAYARFIAGSGIDHMAELSYWDRRRIHNLKYFTWVEQQGKTYDEIEAQWNDRDYWTQIQALVEPIDHLIEEFNRAVGLLPV